MRVALFVGLVLAIAPYAQGSVIYGNLAEAWGNWHWTDGPGTPEFGDLVTFAGTERTLTSMSVRAWAASESGTIDVTFWVRAIDPGTGLPGAALSQASLFGYSHPIANFLVTMNMPAVTLPDQVFVTAQLVTDVQAGVVYGNPPEVGSSDASVWYARDRNTQEWGAVSGVFPFGNLNFQVNAVPEPATLAVLGVGSLFAALRKGRRNRP